RWPWGGGRGGSGRRQPGSERQHRRVDDQPPLAVPDGLDGPVLQQAVHLRPGEPQEEHHVGGGHVDRVEGAGGVRDRSRLDGHRGTLHRQGENQRGHGGVRLAGSGWRVTTEASEGSHHLNEGPHVWSVSGFGSLTGGADVSPTVTLGTRGTARVY